MDLNPRQKEAVEYGDGPLMIAAGAGSGKTKTLTSRLIALLGRGIAPERIIAITFTNKAADEMRDRITNSLQPMTNNTNDKVISYKLSVNSQPFIGTFHSLGARILRSEAGYLGRTAAFSIFDSEDALSLVRKTIRALELNREDYPAGKLMNSFSRIKSLVLNSSEELAPVELGAFETYERKILEFNGFDFDDLIEKVVRLFQTKPAVLKKYQGLFSHILVDEYQDINPAQYSFIRLLGENHRNLSVVGDDAQAIYGWRFADIKNFLDFENDWPEAKVVTLEQNYRSSANIIQAASGLISHNAFQRPKKLWTENEPGSAVTVVAARDEADEAEWITETIRAITGDQKVLKHSKDVHGDHAIAILYRTNAQSRALEQACLESDIPYRIFGGIKFYERKEVKDIVAALRFASNPKDELSAERIEKTFTRSAAASLLKELPGKNTLPPFELIGFILNSGGYASYLKDKFTNSEERMENVVELMNFASGFNRLENFLERVSLLQATDIPAHKLITKNLKQKTPVNLMTIHMAKGLEFDIVFVAGSSEGVIPHRMSYGSQEGVEEERRLMYVAMTRAKRNLYLTFTNLPSRFLYEIPPELTEFVNLKGDSHELPDEDEIYLE